MQLWQAIVLGIVQGLTEFLPISSTAHLRITPDLLGFRDPGAGFTAIIQLGTLLSVLWYFRADIARLLELGSAGLVRGGLLPLMMRGLAGSSCRNSTDCCCRVRTQAVDQGRCRATSNINNGRRAIVGRIVADVCCRNRCNLAKACWLGWQEFGTARHAPGTWHRVVPVPRSLARHVAFRFDDQRRPIARHDARNSGTVFVLAVFASDHRRRPILSLGRCD